MNRCEYIIIEDKKHEGFRCPNKTYNKYCNICVKRIDIKSVEQLVNCINIISNGYYQGFECEQKVNRKVGLCNRCTTNIFGRKLVTLGNDTNQILNELCSYKRNEPYYDRYFKMVDFTQEQLYKATQITLDQHNNYAAKMLFSFKFMPELFNYDLLFHKNMTPEIESSFYYKRFLIKSCLESFGVVTDCINLILNPFDPKLEKCSKFKRFILHENLFHCGDKFFTDGMFFIGDLNITLDVDAHPKYKNVYVDNKIFNNYLIYYLGESSYIIGKQRNGVIEDLDNTDIEKLSQIKYGDQILDKTLDKIEKIQQIKQNIREFC